MCAGLVLVIAAGVLMGLVSGVLLLFAVLILIRRSSLRSSLHFSPVYILLPLISLCLLLLKVINSLLSVMSVKFRN